MTDFPVWLVNSPMTKCASDEFTITDTLVGGRAITAATSAIYLGSTDKTSDCMTGSATFTSNSNVYITPTIKSMKGGNTYVVATVVTIDGVKTTRKFEIRVQKSSDLQ
jgi:hypothetical protein